jgi:lysophospholipase L1-like esterase
MKQLIFLLVSTLLLSTAIGQKKVVVIGSSTAEGQIGLDNTADAFVERLKAYYPGHTFINLALRGTNTYQALPASVPGKPAIDPARNITAALAENPDIILVAYPTNDVANGYSNEETVNNLQTIYAAANAQSKVTYIIGTQPRDFGDDLMREKLSIQNALIQVTFPLNFINVYPDLVGINFRRHVDVAYTGDAIHLNAEGHRRIFQKIVDFNIFQSFGALPVTLTRFNAEMVRGKSVLHWETSSEINNAAFKIQRSINGTDFTVVGEVKGKGNSNAVNKYSFTDPNPAPGKNLYRLQQVDLDNRTSYSNTISLDNRVSQTNWTAYPIPAQDQLNISNTLPASTTLQLSILSIQGLPVYTAKRNTTAGLNRFSIPLSTIPAGMYQLKLESPQGIQLIPFIKH